MERSASLIGPKGLIKKHEFTRLIIQSLYSLGYRKSAYSLELESGISHKSADIEMLESQIAEGNWNGCIDTLNGIKELDNETRASVLFLVFKQCMLEYLSCGNDSMALSVLRKQVPALRLGKENICSLAYSLLYFKDMELSKIDDNVIFDRRNRLLAELEQLLPPPILLPERRLEHLVETALTAQIDSCIYHNSLEGVSVYEDHCCTREEIPTETIQVCSLFTLKIYTFSMKKRKND